MTKSRWMDALLSVELHQPSVAVTTERGARWRYGCRTYGLDEGRHGISVTIVRTAISFFIMLLQGGPSLVGLVLADKCGSR
jgi:hypothetical protein